MTKGEWAWRVMVVVIFLLIIQGITLLYYDTVNGDYHCPIVRDDGTEMVFCFSIRNWTEYCDSIGCEAQRFWCGRPGCQCQEEFMHDNNQ